MRLCWTARLSFPRPLTLQACLSFRRQECLSTEKLVEILKAPFVNEGHVDASVMSITVVNGFSHLMLLRLVQCTSQAVLTSLISPRRISFPHSERNPPLDLMLRERFRRVCSLLLLIIEYALRADCGESCRFHIAEMEYLAEKAMQLGMFRRPVSSYLKNHLGWNDTGQLPVRAVLTSGRGDVCLSSVDVCGLQWVFHWTVRYVPYHNRTQLVEPDNEPLQLAQLATCFEKALHHILKRKKVGDRKWSAVIVSKAGKSTVHFGNPRTNATRDDYDFPSRRDFRRRAAQPRSRRAWAM